MNKTRLIFVIFIFFFLGGIAFFLYKRAQTPAISNNNGVSRVIDAIVPNATPLPFEELTIPYLRNRQYKSTLGEMQRLSETATYTSYLTNYDLQLK